MTAAGRPLTRRLPIPAKAAAIALAVACAAPVAARAQTACAELTRVRLPHAEVTAATLEPLKSGGEACRVRVVSRPTADSDIRIEVWIPEGVAWNGKFVQVGNGGLAGAIPVGAIRARAEAGYAAAGTDDGHEAPSQSAAWAFGHPEKVKDFAWRAVRETTLAAKALIAARTGAGPRWSYFAGCSAGGREALAAAQRFPDAFDGIVAGAPGNYNTLLTGGRLYVRQMLAQPGAYLDLEALKLLQRAALRRCGHGGAYIRDPLACRFDPGELQCRPGQARGCLRPAQVASARAIYAGRPGPDGKPAFAGMMPGAEADPEGVQAWITGRAEDRIGKAAGVAIGSQVMKAFIYDDPDLDVLSADLGARFDHDRQRAAAEIDATDPDLSAFARRGGKLIQFHGWNDPAIPPLGSVRYYEAVGAEMGDTRGFYRLYMIPGMLHCRGGPGPSRVDWLQLLDAWVTKGAAPAAVIAKSDKGDRQLLCPYPTVARPGGWRCAAPPARRP